MSDDFHLKLSDFGDAKRITEEDENEMDQMMNGSTEEEEETDDRNSLFGDNVERNARGSFVGSPLYVSPEMLEDNCSHPSNDLWALGIIVY